ncbi:DUF1661 domain-containing protein [Porphyromonas gulae]|uniref:DUF1661 domain-containing protein n=1 Tax=Porphyromonas gulae TaxID=111105 RepID=UPI0026EFFA46|nr:DUF1661 domain-containing protein [Porphyromonas gulae]
MSESRTKIREKWREIFFVYAREIFHSRTKTKKFPRHVFSPHVPCIFGLRTAI